MTYIPYEKLMRAWTRYGNAKKNTPAVLDMIFDGYEDDPPAEYTAWPRLRDNTLDLVFTLNTRAWIAERVEFEPRLTRLFYEKFLQWHYFPDSLPGDWDWWEKILEFREWWIAQDGDLWMETSKPIYTRDDGDERMSEDFVYAEFTIGQTIRGRMRSDFYYSGDEGEFMFLWANQWSKPIVFRRLLSFSTDVTLRCPNCFTWWDYSSRNYEYTDNGYPLLPDKYWRERYPDRVPVYRDLIDYETGIVHLRPHALRLPTPFQTQLWPGYVCYPKEAAIQRWRIPPVVGYNIHPERGIMPVREPRLRVWVDEGKIICPLCGRAKLEAESRID